MKTPHEGVFTRLQSSEIHGVGVFAISDIPKGQYVFEPDDAETVLLNLEDTKVLPQKIRKLYEDFCVLKNGIYECPASFNCLTPSWYLNNSSDPNIAADASLKFYAIRDIREGEELTANYETYSENEANSKLG